MDVHGGPFPAGGFYAGIDPETGEKRLLPHVTPDEAHYALTAMAPVPASVWLGLGLLGGLGVTRFVKRRRAA